MTSFSGEDLKRLEELLDDPQASGFFTEGMARGIIYRLKASEWALKGFQDLECEKVNYDDVCQRLKAWRKAAGL